VESTPAGGDDFAGEFAEEEVSRAFEVGGGGGFGGDMCTAEVEGGGDGFKTLGNGVFALRKRVIMLAIILV